MWRSFRNFLLVVVSALLLSSCATVIEPSATWKDPAYVSHPEKILVVGVARKAVNRRLFEDAFVSQLRAHGLDAVASYTILPDDMQNDSHVVSGKVLESGADTVIITRTVDRKTVQSYVPGTVFYPPMRYRTWPDYYDYGYDAMYFPGYVAEDEFETIETNVYDVESDKLVWASTTEMGTMSPIQERIGKYIGAIMTAMARQGLL